MLLLKMLRLEHIRERFCQAEEGRSSRRQKRYYGGGNGSRTDILEEFARMGCANVRAGPYAVAGAWCCGMMPTMLNVDPCISQVRTPKWGDAASESLVSTIMKLDPETAISYEGVL
jgi:hypothetical protein